MSDDLDFIVIDDIPEYTFCIPDDEELENVIPVKGEDGSFKYEKVAELPATGEDGVLYLVPKSHETQTASGNPISINVTEGAGKLTDLKLDGGASQNTIPSPNPDYPQDINVVTGTQTIDINGTSYPISLGNIELAEIGAYRDYIHKVGNEWKVHKATGKIVLNGANTNISWSRTPITGGKSFWFRSNTIDALLERHQKYCDNFTYVNQSYLTAPIPCLCENSDWTVPNNFMFIFNVPDELALTTDDWKTWLRSHPTTVYYALATAIDTTITDTALIAQLEAARNAALANGTNVISNTATGNNLAGDLELSYYEYDPTNKYNKWLWLADDAAYEQM